jgi:hypothetical protein
MLEVSEYLIAPATLSDCVQAWIADLNLSRRAWPSHRPPASGWNVFAQGVCRNSADNTL